MKQENNTTASCTILNVPVYCHGEYCSRKDRCVNHRIQSGAQIVDYSTGYSYFKEHEEGAVRKVYCCFPVGSVIYDDAGSPWQIETVSIDEDIWYSIVLVDDLKGESVYQRRVLLLDKDIDGKHWFAYDPTISHKNA